MPPICSVSVGECCQELVKGGASIGSYTIKSLAFVDDIMGINTTIDDVHHSHDTICFFSSKKKMPLNETKCNILTINNKSPHAVPVLMVNGKQMVHADKIKYLGDIFNKNGSNHDLIEDRINKGKRCIINTICECRAVTNGCKEIQTLILMYKTLFIPTLIYNSEAWSNLTNNEAARLQRIQLNFLKRILQVPKSTPNAIVYLELGIIPIANEIHCRQLRFLHHILNLELNDPVRRSYNQLKMFPFENNWYYEVVGLLKMYSINITEEEIASKTLFEWKSIIKRSVTSTCLMQLNVQKESLSIGSSIPNYTTMRRNAYYNNLSPQHARTMFRIRSGTLDVKVMRRYLYDDTLCRLCGQGDEDVEHIVNKCSKLPPRTVRIRDLFTNNTEDMKSIADRCITFAAKLDDQSNCE